MLHRVILPSSPPPRRFAARRVPGFLAAAAAPLLLAGVFPVGPAPDALWYLSGAWFYPVGHPLDFTLPYSADSPPFVLRRNLGSKDEHQGADLSNMSAKSEVRAAAHGMVVHCVTSHWTNGFGLVVVLAHRSPDDVLTYSVYAHLAPGSVAVREGQVVLAGQRLGRVGRTGRATSPHLHFEIRRPRTPWERWERAPAVDPVAFVSDRLPRSGADTSWAAPNLDWAQCAGLTETEPAHQPITRLAWHRMVTGAHRARSWSALERPVGRTVPDRGQEGAVSWAELTEDLAELARRDLPVPPAPLDPETRRSQCKRLLGIESARDAREKHRHRRASPPTLAEACLLLSLVRGD